MSLLFVKWSTLLIMFVSVILIYFRRRQILDSFKPYVVFSIVAVIAEITMKILIVYGQKTTVFANFYVLIEFPILLWLFYVWSSRRNLSIFIGLFLAGLLIWVIDNLILNSLFRVNSYYRIYYSTVLILCSINQINKIIFSENGKLWLNAQFLICITSIIYYSYKIFVEALFMFQSEVSNEFLIQVYLMMMFVNLFAHLIYTLAILCIPTRREFTLQY